MDGSAGSGNEDLNKNQAPEELRLEIRERDDYEIHPASSVRGGVQLQGDFIIEFLLDTYEDPGAEIYSMENGVPGEFIRHEEFQNAVVRRKQTGVLMSQSNAYSVARWILANLLGESITEEDIEDLLMSEFEDQLTKDGETNEQ